MISNLFKRMIGGVLLAWCQVCAVKYDSSESFGEPADRLKLASLRRVTWCARGAVITLLGKKRWLV